MHNYLYRNVSDIDAVRNKKMNKFIFHFSHHLLYLYMKRLFILLLIVLLCIPGFTQIRNDVPRYNPDSVRKELDKRPYFSLYKDNYFIGGTTIGSKPTNKNSDVKFQLSISQRLTKSKLPFDTYLFITYTQKAFGMSFKNLSRCTISTSIPA